jgi:hypothetical protein
MAKKCCNRSRTIISIPTTNPQQKQPSLDGLNSTTIPLQEPTTGRKSLEIKRRYIWIGNNSKGLMTMVSEAMKTEDDLERILLLLPGKTKAIQVFQSCFPADKKIWGTRAPQVIYLSTIIDQAEEGRWGEGVTRMERRERKRGACVSDEPAVSNTPRKVHMLCLH